MPTFRLSVRPLGDSFHGRRDGGEPEWPPSPLRGFQALVAAAAGRWRMNQFECYACPALEWLERLGSPMIVAPPGRVVTQPYRLYVPNNASDVVAAAWARGNPNASIAEHRTEKDVRPTRFADGHPVHFDWPLTPAEYEEGKAHHLGTLKAAAGSITHLGWGVDQAVGHAEVLLADPEADPSTERWLPVDTDDGTPLRVPIAGTLAKLMEKHEAFLGRLSDNGFKPVPPLTAFRVVGYRRATDPVSPFQWAAYRILSADPDASTNPAFDTPRRARDVACWVRNAAGRVCEGQGWDDVARFVHGHDPADDAKPAKGEGADDRLMYLPLPTINSKLNRVESVRRVLVAGPAACRVRIERVGRLLEGEELKWGDEVKGLLVPLAASSDWVLRQYVGEARTWSTVTPVVWPGHDDRDARKAGRILRKAFEDAGLPKDLVAAVPDADLEWRNVGFRPGVDLASRYEKPDKLAGRASHVRVRFPHPVKGPLAVGAGRYRGMGVFAAEG